MRPTLSFLTIDEIKELKESDKEFYLSPFLGDRINVPYYTEIKSSKHLKGIYNDGKFERLNENGKPVERSYPRIVLNYNRLNWNKEWDDLEEVEIGYFPQDEAKGELAKKLRDKLDKKELNMMPYNVFDLPREIKGGKKFNLNISHYIPSVIIDAIGRYGRYGLYFNLEDKKFYLFDYYKRNDFHEIKAIKWIVDKVNKRLIQKEAVFPGTYSFNDAVLAGKEFIFYLYHEDFERSANRLSEKYHQKMEYEKEINAIIDKANGVSEQLLLEEKEINPKEQDVQEIVDEIMNLLPNYYGKADIKKQITFLIGNYNDKIKKLNKVDGNSFLSLENTDRNALYNTLLFDLKGILDKLKNYVEHSKDYREMLDRIRNCRKDAKEMDQTKDDISSDIYVIKANLLKFLGEEETNKKLDNILEEEEKLLLNKLTNLPSSSDELKELAELKRDFASKMKPFLVELNEKVNKKEILDEISSSYISISKDKYDTTKDSTITFYLKNLNKLLDEIRRKGNIVENSRAYAIINKTIDYNQDFDLILKDLSSRNIALNKIILEMEERKKNESDIIGVSFDNDKDDSIIYYGNDKDDHTSFSNRI